MLSRALDSRKNRTSENHSGTARHHRRECLVSSITPTETKDTVREASIKLMAMMKAKRECRSFD